MTNLAQFLDRKAGRGNGQGAIGRVRPVGREAEERFILTGELGPKPVEPFTGGGMGGPGIVVPYTDDGVHLGPGEIEEENHYDLLFLW